MQTSFRRRGLWLLAAMVLGGLALAGGIAYATIPDSSGIIHGCRNNGSGALRVIDSASQSCTSAETPLNWVQSAAFEAFGGLFGGTTTNPIEITSTSFASPTHVLTLHLGEGAYVLAAQVFANKPDGRERLVCFVNGGQQTELGIQLRSALGTHPGYTKIATISGTGTVVSPTGGADAELVCVQRDMTGSNAGVLGADLTATRVASVTTGAGT